MNWNLDLSSLLNELRNLDFNNIGSWSDGAKAIAILFCCALVGFMGYWLFVRDQFGALERVRAKEPELRTVFETKAQKAANLEEYKTQLAQMQASFGTLVQQLPSETEIANLLQDISQTRVAVGLEEQLFKPDPERAKEFYAEAPIQIRVLGSYHQFAEFASGLATLPRIVTLGNIQISGGKNGKETLVMNATAMTYRYLEKGKNARPNRGKR